MYTAQVKPWKSSSWVPPSREAKRIAAMNPSTGMEKDKVELSHHERAARGESGEITSEAISWIVADTVRDFESIAAGRAGGH